MRDARLWLLGSCLVLALAARHADARPGGGHSSHGSSHYSHSHGSHGHSALDPPDAPDSPAVTLVVIALGIVGGPAFAWMVTYAMRAANRKVRDAAAATQSGLRALHERDPAFEETAFRDRVAVLIARVNDAWCAGDMSPARRFLSDGVYTRFQTQLRLNQLQNRRNVMARWMLVETDIVGAEVDDRWQALDVCMRAEAKDIDVDFSLPLEEAQRQARASTTETYSEIWSFLRRTGRATDPQRSLVEGHCPSCGAPIALAEMVRCDHCKALINSGEHDWVLAEITQFSDWSREEPHPTPGRAALERKDPTVSPEALKDRASVIFWKWIEAQVRGTSASLDRFCLTPGWTLGQQSLSDVVVGKTDLRAVDGDAAFDRCTIAITWSGKVAGQDRQLTTGVVLARPATATSAHGLSALECHRCGAPLADSDVDACSHCGERLRLAPGDWGLERIIEGGDSDAIAA